MKRALLAAAVVFAAARCATVVNDTTEKIPVRSNPAGAVVSVDCGDAPLYGGVTPTTISVPRAAMPCSITLAKEGYVPTRIDFQRQLSRAVGANKVAAAPRSSATSGFVGGLPLVRLELFSPRVYHYPFDIPSNRLRSVSPAIARQ